MEKEEKKVKVTEEEYLKLSRSNEKKKAIIVIISFVAILFAMVALLFYLGIINNGPKEIDDNKETNNCQCEKCECENAPVECNCPKCPTYSGCLGEKISSIKEIELTNKNQTVKVGKKEYKIRIGKEANNYPNVDDSFDEYLIIDDLVVFSNYFGDPISVYHTYVTDKYIIFTMDAQRGEQIAYVIGEQGEIHYVYDGDIPSDSESMHNLQIKDGYLYTDEFLIKYIDNVLLVVNKNN